MFTVCHISLHLERRLLISITERHVPRTDRSCQVHTLVLFSAGDQALPHDDDVYLLNEVGGFTGAAAFFPERLADRPGSPAVALTDFKISGVSVPISSDSPLTRSITYTDGITLSHAQNLFSITFAGLDYLRSQTTRYRYRLEGLEHQWNEVGSDQRHATYTTLPAGRYPLRVQAARSRGAWNEVGAKLAIEIHARME